MRGVSVAEASGLGRATRDHLMLARSVFLPAIDVKKASRNEL